MKDGVWLLSARDAAERLNVTERHVRRMDAAGRIPEPVRVGGRRLWRVKELAEWVEQGCPGRAAWNERRKAQ